MQVYSFLFFEKSDLLGTFYCQGTDISGGDCDVLRIESRGAGAYHEVLQ